MSCLLPELLPSTELLVLSFFLLSPPLLLLSREFNTHPSIRGPALLLGRVSRGSRGCIQVGSGARLSAQGRAHPQRPPSRAVCHSHQRRGFSSSHQPCPTALSFYPQEMPCPIHPMGFSGCPSNSTVLFGCLIPPPRLTQEGCEGAVRVKAMGWGQQGSRLHSPN